VIISTGIKDLPIQLGLDPSRITFEAIYARVLDFILVNTTLTNTLALLGASFFVATLLMRTIVPLRVSAIISDVFFLGYGVLARP
jgi:hypothetical protein